MIKKVINIIVIIVVFCMSHYVLAAPDIEAEGAILIEPKSNTILYEKNAHQRFYPASITKILTALIVEEQLPEDAVIYKTQDSVNQVPTDSSHIPLEIGDSYTKANGLYGLLLGSDNFIAHDLACKVSGNISDFAVLMNQKAKQAGAVNSHFVNPHGYHDPNHYTTPYDMAQIARAAFSNEAVQRTAGTLSYNLNVSNKNKTLSITNSSRLLKSETPYYNPHVVACKTGFHDEARQTLVAKAKYGDMELIAVVMKVNTPNQYIDVNKLFEYGSSYFTVEKVKGDYIIRNNTSSNWSRLYIESAIKEGWLKEKGDNYQETIKIQDLVILLKKAGVKFGGVTMTEVQNLTGLKLGQTITREEASQVAEYALEKWGVQKAVLSNDPNILDISEVTGSIQDSVYYTVKRGVLGTSGKAFRPNEKLSLEEAICMVYKLIH